jgi:hypothetical protein
MGQIRKMQKIASAVEKPISPVEHQDDVLAILHDEVKKYFLGASFRGKDGGEVHIARSGRLGPLHELLEKGVLPYDGLGLPPLTAQL